ncbi:hypothetical protein [Paraburkholderia tropica]|uniref:hypothetical protein n=1 Tax=Paraburkholderia tropica TaxID=92647 RepID=UPI002AB1FCC0|nr:hypothetical protein [Paraburkholderia tropica]
MKLKTRLSGAMLIFTAFSAHALDMRSAQPAAPISASETQATPTIAQAALAQERLRQMLVKNGFDPDSPKGQSMMKFFARLATDEAFRVKFTQFTKAGDPFGGQLSPDDRVRVLRLLSHLAQGPKNDCAVLQADGKNFIVLANALSPQGLQDLLDAFEIIVADDEGTSSDEHYTLAELLDAEAEVESVLDAKLTVQPDVKEQAAICQVMGSGLDAINDLPGASRERATYAIFHMLGSKTSPRASVQADPFAYLDDMFDERRMPDALRGKLPANGSHPMPYSRLVIDGEWRHQSAPNQPSPFTDTYVNRRNNGVVAEVVTPVVTSGSPGWSHFYLSYGVQDLLTQNVGTRVLTRLGTLKDGAAIDAASRPMLEGRTLEMPVPLPSEDGETARSCQVGKTVPASTIFRTFEGDAVDLHCQYVTKKGKTTRYDAALLMSYGIQLWKSYDSEDGHTDVVIRNVTIQQP